MTETWYGNLTEVEGAALGRLAVIAPWLERMGVADISDRHLPVDPQAEFTHDRLLGLLLAARVSSPVALSPVAEWAGQSGADILRNIAAGRRRTDELFTRFKRRGDSEQVSSQFQGPLAVRPVFLHSPRRLEALMFLMVIALMLYCLIQRTHRASLTGDAPLKEWRITTRTLLDAFRNDTLLIQHHRPGREVSPARLTARQKEILQHPGRPMPAQLLHRLLPRPPG